ncbi:MAG: segregation/condensation protein A [Phycisphaerales bacterium]|nr:segregation/condensation protein A [Planctomycetota bacterium]MCH8509530.1 segregation/condensation protein A [Phycisphaerales bacterium]
MSETYRVHLEAFDGPLDLLLYLIRRDEVDLHDIPIASIADQYIASIEDLDRVDIDLAGEFLVMAATLMEIKSRMLAAENLRKDEPEGHEADKPEKDKGDPRAELVRQLLEYKKFRDAADALDRRRAAWESRFPVRPAGVDNESVREALAGMGELEIEDLDLGDLVEAFRQIVSSVNFDRLGDHAVVSDDTPLELHAEDIVDRLGTHATRSTGRKMTLREIMEGRSRPEMVGLFLALLVLVRDQRVGFKAGAGGVELNLLSAEPGGASDQ